MGTDHTVYFEWPSFRGSVYSVLVPADEGTFRVSLPEGDEVLVEVAPDRFPLVDEVPAEDDGYTSELWLAEYVFSWEESSVVFSGDWEPLIELINAAAAVNTLFEVVLTAEEYARLAGGEFERLKSRLSPRAQMLLYMVPETPDGRQFTVQLYRTGRCP